jgi:hypothetical protein
MKDNLIKQALNLLADQGIPENYDPTTGVKNYVETHIHTRNMPSEGRPQQLRLRLASVAALVVLLSGVVFFLTPQGRGFAQQVIHYFTFAEGDALPLPTGYSTELPPPTRTPAPTQMVVLQEGTPAVEAAGVMSYPTDTPAPAAPLGEPVWNLTIEEAAQLAGFEVTVPTSLAPGYRLDNVIFVPERGEIAQFYEFHPYSAGEMFILSQRRSAPEDVIGQSAQVEQLMVGEVAVEYVKGGWADTPAQGVETWAPDQPFHTFRWQQGDYYYNLMFLFDDSDTWSPAYWTKAGMLAMIEVITGQRTNFPQQVNYNNITSIAQAEEIAGFDLLVPSILPEGFAFIRAIYEPVTERVILVYQPEEGSRQVSGVSLRLIESQDTSHTFTWQGYPPEAVEQVQVGSLPATFARGIVLDGVYQPDNYSSLIWNNAGLALEVIYSTSPGYPARLEKEDLLVIAESMQ